MATNQESIDIVDELLLRARVYIDAESEGPNALLLRRAMSNPDAADGGPTVRQALANVVQVAALVPGQQARSDRLDIALESANALQLRVTELELENAALRAQLAPMADSAAP